MKHIVRLLSSAMLVVAAACSGPGALDELKAGFVSPPDDARPGVYWYFMDGNLSKEGMTKDLEAMKEAGIGYVIFLEVNAAVERGPVDFMSPEWKDCFVHAVRECERLGIAMTLGTGPGWAGSGGPWVDGHGSMQHLVSSATDVAGGSRQTIALPVPEPMKPFFGESALTPELKQRWKDYYEDVAVIAFPTVSGRAAISDPDYKALYYRAPYSSQPGVPQFMGRDGDTTALSADDVVCPDSIVDLTTLLADGKVTWDVPRGRWTIMRIGARNNGAVTRPAPMPGVGFECDKADSSALMAHLREFTGQLLALLGDRDTTLQGGLKYLHIDSWEMGAQNWTPRLRQEFTARRGYDPQPYYPVYAGYVVGSVDRSERFLWDLRMTMQELMLENHMGATRRYAHANGMRLSNEPYDMNPTQDLELGAAADVVMAEFWSLGGFNTSFSTVEATSAANVKGQRVVPAESFTAHLDGWRQHPASMKNQTDWAFAAGINRLTFHTFQHQALPDDQRPGMTMGPYGVHWDRNQTWWPYVGAYHKYIGRCQHMLQKGQTVADVLYLTPEEAPFVFRAPKSALEGDEVLIDRRGYNFDACPPSLLYGATVTPQGKVRFPSGAEYSLIVLPEFATMTPTMLDKITSLVEAGATAVGLPPSTTPGLSGYPESETRLKEMTARLWGDDATADGLVGRTFGRGKIYTGAAVARSIDNMYPGYELTSALLRDSLGIVPAFQSASGSIRHIQKHYADVDYYFVANRTPDAVTDTLTLRVSGLQPQLWNPVTGQMHMLTSWTDNGTTTSIPMAFDGYQSYFIVMAGKPTHHDGTPNFPQKSVMQTVDGPWNVAFDPRWGGPENATFTELTDWTESTSDSIRYYSGTAVYTTTFDAVRPADGSAVTLSLGDVKNIARVSLNGHDLGVVWSMPWEVGATEALVDGTNELTVEVTNLWPNRLIGDERDPAHRYTSTTFRHYTAESPLLPSGLLGPVRLVKASM